MEIFKTYLDVFLCNIFQGTCFRVVELDDLQRSLPTPTILCNLHKHKSHSDDKGDRRSTWKKNTTVYQDKLQKKSSLPFYLLTPILISCLPSSIMPTYCFMSKMRSSSCYPQMTAWKPRLLKYKSQQAEDILGRP